MTVESTASTSPATAEIAAITPGGRSPRRGSSIRGRQAAAGWLFTAPVILLVVLFLVIPMVMALWVSVSNWTGIGSPFSADVKYVGARNYSFLLSQDGLARQNPSSARIEASAMPSLPGLPRMACAALVARFMTTW